MELINKDNKETSDALLEQYKLYVEMMDKVSERRGNANSFLKSGCLSPMWYTFRQLNVNKYTF